MYVADHVLGVGSRFRVIGRVLGGCGGDGGFVVEAVEVASRLPEIFDPLLRLFDRSNQHADLCESDVG